MRTVLLILLSAGLLAAQFTPPNTGGGGGGTPGGSNKQIQYNNNGSFGGSSVTFDPATGNVSFAGAISLSGPGAGVAMTGCGTQTLPASPANSGGVIGAASCTGQHVLATPATGASGANLVLTSTGTESGGVTGTQWAPAGGGTSGALILVEEHTASSSATVAFTTCISSTYDDYIFKFVNINPASSATAFEVQFGTGATPTWDTGSNYKWASWASNQIPATGASGNATDTSATFLASLSNAATSGLSGTFTLSGPGDSTFYKVGTWQFGGLQSSSNFSQITGAVQYISATPVTAVRFLMASGNVAAGNIRCYGVAH